MPGENAKWEGSLPASFSPSPLWSLYLHGEGSDPGIANGDSQPVAGSQSGLGGATVTGAWAGCLNWVFNSLVVLSTRGLSSHILSILQVREWPQKYKMNSVRPFYSKFSL